MNDAGSVSTPSLRHVIHEAITAAGGWLPFDRFMALALYTPGLGYYARGAALFGQMPRDGSDFVTAPELSPLFGATLAANVVAAFAAGAPRHVIEFGAGSGALAAALLDELGDEVQSYTIVELSGALRERQARTLARHAAKLRWLDAWPERFDGVVLGNEVLDAMPVQLLHFDGTHWFERGVVINTAGAPAESGCLGWADRPTALRPPAPDTCFLPDAVTEIHPQAEAFMRSLAERLHRGAAFFIDYGFPEHEYYHPQRHGGTLMCHRRHVADTDPLQDVGEKDITAHVNFSAIALAAQDAGLAVDGYTSQARFLINSGLVERLAAADVRSRTLAMKLIDEHEMGELFKVLVLSRGLRWQPAGLASGDRSHTL